MMESLEISVVKGWSDYQIFYHIISQGIDSKLEAFTKSKFWYDSSSGITRFYMEFPPDEVNILLRRLCFLEEKVYEDGFTWRRDKDLEDLEFVSPDIIWGWITDILLYYYGVETI